MRVHAPILIRRLATLALALGLALGAAHQASAAKRLTRKQQKESLIKLLGAFELRLSKPALDTLGWGLDESLVEISGDQPPVASLQPTRPAVEQNSSAPRRAGAGTHLRRRGLGPGDCGLVPRLHR